MLKFRITIIVLIFLSVFLIASDPIPHNSSIVTITRIDFPERINEPMHIFINNTRTGVISDGESLTLTVTNGITRIRTRIGDVNSNQLQITANSRVFPVTVNVRKTGLIFKKTEIVLSLDTN
jgi:hypothetical protein